MKNIVQNQPETAVASVYRRPLIVLLSVFIALCILVSALAVLTFVDFSNTGSSNGGNTTAGFDYSKVLLSDYLSFTGDTFKGLTLPGFENRIDDVTDENVKKELDRRLLSLVALTSDAISEGSYYPKYSEAIDYADDVFLYILYAETEDGERVDSKYFESAYIDTITIQIGMGSFGDEFDAGLMGLVPVDTTYFDRRLSGTVGEDDVVILSYTVSETIKATEEGKEDEVKNHKNYTGLRFELASLKEKDAALHEKFVANGVIGQYFSFEHTEDIDGDGEMETVKYEGMIDAVVENEHYHTFEAHLPEDYFGKAPKDETLKALNGAKLTFAVSVAYTVPHDARTWDTMTLGDLASLNAGLNASGVASFVPSNDKPAAAKEDGQLTKDSKALSTLRGEITKLKNEIENLERGDIVKLNAEIAELEEKIAELEASDEDKSAEIVSKTKTLTTKKDTLASKTTSLEEKKATLAEKEAKLEADEAAYEEKMVTAREECVAYFKKELEKSYEASVKYAAGSVVFEHLLEALEFKKLPESEVKDATAYYKEMVEYYYSTLDDYDKRNYRDIHEYAANYVFGYDEAEYATYEAYIDDMVADQIKYYLLVYGIYNEFINDESKLNAKKDELITDFIEYVKLAYETTLSKEEAEYYYPDEVGSYPIEDARYELVIEFLAENNTIDWDTAKN